MGNGSRRSAHSATVFSIVMIHSSLGVCPAMTHNLAWNAIFQLGRNSPGAGKTMARTLSSRCGVPDLNSGKDIRGRKY